MAFSGRIRSGIPLVNKLSRSDFLTNVHRTTLPPALISTVFSNSEFARSYASAPRQKEDRIKVPLVLFGGTGNYASALYLSSVKVNSLDKVEHELLALVEASKNSPIFSQFTKDSSVPAATRVKAINGICDEAKFSDVTKNFLVILAMNGRLRHIESIAKRFGELTMAHRGEVKATVTSVIPLPAEEEKELRETLQYILGQGKKVKLEQKIDPSIMGGLVVEFGQKVFDMSIKSRALQMERFLRQPIDIGNL